MPEIKLIESSDDKRIGRPGKAGRSMPKFDVFGDAINPPFNMWEPGWENVFFILPARPLTADENAQLIAMGESLKSAPVPGTPNRSDFEVTAPLASPGAGDPVQDFLNEPTVRPDFASMDVSADELNLKSEEPSYPPPAPPLKPRRDK